MIKNYHLALIIGLMVFVIDRFTKVWAVATLLLHDVRITPYFSFSLTYNTGIAWSLLADYGLVVKTIGVVMSCYLLYHLFGHAKQRLNLGYSIVGELLVISGGISNIIDRYMYPGVVDFIKISFGVYTFPIFNVADISICLGILILFYSYRGE